MLENGRQVAESEATMGSEYTYGWNSTSCPNHIFRIEAELGVTDQTYYFSIDGQNFNAFPREPMKVHSATKSTANQGRSPAKTYSPSDNKSYAAPKAKGGTQSNSWSDDSDPFTASDPFGDRPAVTSSSNSASPSDPFGDKVTHKQSDPFGGDFKPTTKSATSASFDPFGDEASLPVAKSVTNHHNNKQSGGGGFASHTAAPARSAPAAPAVDLLNDHPIANTSTHKGSYLDDFASFSAPSNGPSPSKDIYSTLNDPFAPKPIIVSTPSNTPITLNTASPNKANDFELDSATKSLVSLDLNPTNKSAPKNRQAEYEKNLPLNTLMGSSNTNKTAVMTSEAIPQQPPMRVMSSAETISALGPAPPRPMMMGGGHPMGGGGLGGNPQLMMGGGMGMGQPQPYGNPMMSQPMGMSGGMSGAMYGGGMQQQAPMSAYGAPRPMPMTAGGGVAQYGSYGQPQAMGSKTSTPQKAGSALDALDWKM